MIIAIDFDSTCVANAFPKIGPDIGAVPILKKLLSYGHKLILFTVRCDLVLDEAINWFDANDIELLGINKNPSNDFSSSPKPYFDLFIDDKALGAPLIKTSISEDPYINWVEVDKFFNRNGYYKTQE